MSSATGARSLDQFVPQWPPLTIACPLESLCRSELGGRGLRAQSNGLVDTSAKRRGPGLRAVGHRVDMAVLCNARCLVPYTQTRHSSSYSA